jgi:hypothetical protein
MLIQMNDAGTSNIQLSFLRPGAKASLLLSLLCTGSFSSVLLVGPPLPDPVRGELSPPVDPSE